MYACINEDLRRRAGLEKLYYYECKPDLQYAGMPIGGEAIAEAFGQPVILLRDGMHEEGAMQVYLHEVAHIIAKAEQLEDPDRPQSHNKYFGLLCAVIYRRVGIFKLFKLYDFSDDWSEAPSNDELIGRFEFIVRHSDELARSTLTLEQIAKKLFEEEILPAMTKEAPMLPTFDRRLRVVAGVAAISAAAVWSYITITN